MDSSKLIYEQYIRDEFIKICDVFKDVDNKKKKLPGPIAYEYDQLVKLVKAGDLAGSCWKIDNIRSIAEIVLKAVDLRYVKRNGWKKYEQSMHGYEKTSQALEKIRNWRNNYGTGHGALVNDFTSHFWDISKCIQAIEDIMDVMIDEKFYINWVEFVKNEKPHSFTLEGNDYLSKKSLTGKGILTAGRKNFNGVKDQTGDNMVVLGSGFNGPDIFFKMYSNDDGCATFRNFRNNSTLFLKKEQGIYNLDTDANRKALEIDFNTVKPNDFIKQACRDLDESKVRSLGEVAGEYFYQEKYKNARIIHRVLSKTSKDLYKKELEIIGSFIDRAIEGPEKPLVGLGYDDKNLFIGNKGCFSEIFFRMMIQLYWKEGNQIGELGVKIVETYKQIDKLLNEYSKGHPFSGSVLKLDLEKTYLYLVRNCRNETSIQDTRNKIQENLEKCKDMLEAVPYHERVVDAYGFFANLFFKSHLRLEGAGLQFMNDADKELIKLYLEDSYEKRAAVYHINPVNIWNIRGFAWSEHVLGRYLMAKDENSNSIEAIACLEKAIGIRKVNLKHFKNIGLFEDTMTGKAEIIAWAAKNGSEEESQRYIKKFKSTASQYLNMEKDEREYQSQIINRLSRKYNVGIEVRIREQGKIEWVLIGA